MVSAADWRDEIEAAIGWAGPYLHGDDDVFPGTFHSYDKLYPEFMEAVVQVESQGDPEMVSPSGAIGLGQLTPDGQEVFWFEERAADMGSPYGPFDVTAETLMDPIKNLRLTAFGLGARFAEAQEITGGKDDQLLAAAGYFGCTVNAAGQAPAGCGDIYTTWEGDGGYRDQLETYIRDNFGEKKLAEMTNLPGTDVTEKARDVSGDVLAGLTDWRVWLPVAGAIVGGLLLVVVGAMAFVATQS